jgi:putative inorganic carbon (HCO3(-)) transporter
VDRTNRAIAIAASVVPIAAVAGMDPAGWYPFGPAKWGAVTVTAVICIAVLFWHGPVRAPRLALWIGAALMVLIGLAALNGLDPSYVWSGTPERRLGFLTWLLFAGCFLVGAALHTEGALTVFASGCVLAGAFTGGYTLVELAFGEPIELDSVTSRLGGPFGSSAYLGAAACLLLPVAAAMAGRAATPGRWRALAGATALALLVALLGSGTRAAWIAIAVTGVVVVASRTHRFAIRTVVACGGALALATAAVATRLTDVLDRQVSSTSRLDEWTVALRVIAERPLLGAGPEGYRIAFADGVDASYERTYGRLVMPDRAHSGPLDVAAFAGVPAAVLYLIILGVVMWFAVSAIRHRSAVRAGFGAAALAYSIQQLALFPIAELDPVFWIVAGITISGSSTLKPRPAPGLPARVGHPVAVGVAAIAALVFVVGILHVSADRLARDAANEPEPDLAARLADRAVDLRGGVVRYRLLAASAHAATGTLAGVDRAIDETQAALETSPGDPIARRQAASYLLERARITGERTDIEGALDAYSELVVDDSFCYECQYGLGLAASLADDAATARRALEEADALARPGVVAAREALERLDELDDVNVGAGDDG